MNFFFQHPHLLWPAAAAALASLLFRPPRGYYRARRAAAIAALRALAAAALVLLAGGLAERAAGGLSLVILADRSESMAGHGDFTERAVAGARRVLRGRARITALDFAARPVPRLPAQPAGAPVAPSDRVGTNLESALVAALPSFEPGGRNLILLLSDGAETDGQARRALPLLRGAGARVLAYDLPRTPGREIELLDLAGPDRARPGQSLELKALVRSSGARQAVAVLTRDGVTLETRSVSLDESGRGEALFLGEAGRPGTYRYRVALEAAPGDRPENNARELELIVEGIDRAVLATEDPGASAWLAGALRETSASLDIVDPTRLTAEALTPEPGLLVLDDLPAASLDAAAVERLETLARGGMGLLAVGGPSSYGAGGYRDTALERLLPVTMGSPGRGPEKEIGLAIILDNSFSMLFRGPGQSLLGGASPRKIDLAKASILEILRILRPQDEIGILLSNESLRWLKRPGPLGADRDLLSGAIAHEDPIGGGINFYSSLLETYQALQQAHSGAHHVMVIADSNDIDQYEVLDRGKSHDLVRAMAQAGITLSIFAIGRPSDKDIAFLRTAAMLGKGDFYLVSEMVSLPRYFVSDARRRKDEWLREETFAPLVKDYTPLLRGFTGSEIPPLAGIDLVSAKAGAEEALISPSGAPVLASWRYGKGRVTAFTGDNGRRWAAGWPGSTAATALLRQVISVTARRPDSGEAGPLARAESARGPVSYLLPEAATPAPLKEAPLVRIEGPGGPLALPLERTGWNRYRSTLPDLPPGLYRYRLAGTASPPGRTDPAGTLQIPVPAEYGTQQGGRALMEELVSGTGGRWIETPEDLARELPPPPRALPDWWFWLSLLAMAALFGEFLLRY